MNANEFFDSVQTELAKRGIPDDFSKAKLNQIKERISKLDENDAQKFYSEGNFAAVIDKICNSYESDCKYSSNCFNLYFFYNYKLEEFSRTSRNFLKHYTQLDLGPLFKGDSILPHLSFCYRQRKQDPLNIVNKKIHLKKRRGFTINPNFNPCELCCGLVNCWSCKNKKYDD